MDTSHADGIASSDALQALASPTQQPQRKHYITNSFGNVEEDRSAKCYRFRPREIPYRGLGGLLTELRRLELDPRTSLIRGGVRARFRKASRIRRLLHDRPDALATLEDRPRTLIPLDLDNLECPEELDALADPIAAVKWARSQLPSPFCDASCVWQWSSSAFLKGNRKLKLHFFYLAERPLTSRELELWRRENDKRELIDPAALRPAQLIYTAKPSFGEGLSDPISGPRSGYLRGEFERVSLTIPDESDSLKPLGVEKAVESPVLDDIRSLSESDTTPYGRAALRNLHAELSGAEKGSRHKTGYRVLFRCGALVSGGLASLDDVVEMAEEAVACNGLKRDRPQDWSNLMRDALNAGAQKPAEKPENEDDVSSREYTEEQSTRSEDSGGYMSRPETRPGALTLHGDLGSGKTRILEQLVEETNGDVLVVTHRRSLVAALSRRMGVPSHLMRLDEGEHEFISGSIVTCLDSLWRVPADRVFSLVIIEESEETFSQLFSETMPRGSSRRSPGSLMSRLKILGRRCKDNGGMVITADAFSGDVTELGLSVISGIDSLDIKKVRHQRGRQGVEINRYERKKDIILSLVRKSQAGKRSVVACTRKCDVLSLERLLTRQGISVLSYHSEMDPSVRDTLRNVEESWSDVQVVLYSPSVDCGVSYDVPENPFDSVYLIADRAGLTAHGWTTLLQMVSRVRGATDIHSYVVGANFLPLRRDEISKELEQQWRATRRAAMRGGYDAPELNLDDDDLFRLRIEAERLKRITTRDRATHFYMWWELRGASVEEASSLGSEEAKELASELVEIGRELKEEAINMAMNSPALSRERLRSDYEPRDARDRASLRRTLTLDVFGQVNAPLMMDDFSGRRRQEIARSVQASLIHDGLWDLAARRDAAAASTGYRAHGEGEAASSHACLVLEEVALGPEWVEWSLLPPATHTRSKPLPALPGCVPSTWTEENAAWEELDEALEAAGLTDFDLRRAGVRRGAGWCKALGTALRYRGIRTKRSQPRRDDGTRKSVYSLDIDSISSTRRLSAVLNARQRGWDIDPLSPDYDWCEWEAAVFDGKWRLAADAIGDSSAELDALLFSTSEEARSP